MKETDFLLYYIPLHRQLPNAAYLLCLLIQSVTAACPGSPVKVHASCDLTITFPTTSCQKIEKEILARNKGIADWKDPHNNGQYNLKKDAGKVLGSRLTGDGVFLDLIEFDFKPLYGGNGCTLHACSESQVKSILDFGTNYCNLKNLYCNSEDGCRWLRHDSGEYTEQSTSWGSCWQLGFGDCLSSADYLSTSA